MKIQKRLAVLVMSLVVCCAFSITAYAHDVPDSTKTGTVSGTMVYNEEAVGGGTLTFYKAGDVTADDGNYSFTLTEAFAESGVSLDDLTDKTLATTLAAYVEGSGISGTTIDIASDGTWVAEGLELGLYLVVQNDAADGFEAITPFIVSVPVYDEETESYVYDVSAEPKLSALTEAPTTAPEETTTQAATTDTETTLPQTGQLNWPVPLLAVIGLGLFLAGWGMYFGKQKKSYAA